MNEGNGGWRGKQGSGQERSKELGCILRVMGGRPREYLGRDSDNLT